MAILMWDHPYYVLFWEHIKLSTIFKRAFKALSAPPLFFNFSIVQVKRTALAHDTSSF